MNRKQFPMVEIRIEPAGESGQVQVDIHGLEGPVCESVAADFSALGQRRESKRKPEYSRVSNQAVRRGGVRT